MDVYRTHNCNELSVKDVDKKVILSGWVHRIRDHGGVLFIDLRDHYGITQVVIDPDSKDFVTAEKLRSEWCIQIIGKVKLRDHELINRNLSTGEIEVFIETIKILTKADDLPIPVFGDLEYPEETRLKYDSRFKENGLHKNMVLRSNVISQLDKKCGKLDLMNFKPNFDSFS